MLGQACAAPAPRTCFGSSLLQEEATDARQSESTQSCTRTGKRHLVGTAFGRLRAAWAQTDLQSSKLCLQGCVELLGVPHAGLEARQQRSQLALGLVTSPGQAAAWVCLLALPCAAVVPSSCMPSTSAGALHNMHLGRWQAREPLSSMLWVQGRCTLACAFERTHKAAQAAALDPGVNRCLLVPLELRGHFADLPAAG